jgi:hypothetical protein
LHRSGSLAAGAEAMIRMFAVETPEGPVFANTLLLPKRWDAIAAHHRSVLAKTAAEGSFLMADDYLGWTIAPGRSSRDYNRSFVHRLLAERRKDCSQPAPDATAPDESDPEIYFSSAEGLRSARAPGSHSRAIPRDSGSRSSATPSHSVSRCRSSRPGVTSSSASSATEPRC